MTCKLISTPGKTAHIKLIKQELLVRRNNEPGSSTLPMKFINPQWAITLQGSYCFSQLEKSEPKAEIRILVGVWCLRYLLLLFLNSCTPQPWKQSLFILQKCHSSPSFPIKHGRKEIIFQRTTYLITFYKWSEHSWQERYYNTSFVGRVDFLLSCLNGITFCEQKTSFLKILGERSTIENLTSTISAATFSHKINNKTHTTAHHFHFWSQFSRDSSLSFPVYQKYAYKKVVGTYS